MNEEQATQAQDSVSVEVSRTSTGKFSYSVKVKVFAPSSVTLDLDHADYARKIVNLTMDRLREQYGEGTS